MSNKIQSVRGTKDLFSSEFALFKHVVDVARSVSGLYGFKEMALPIFEFTEVFQKTLGEESDVVGKEMYSFLDRGGESITLRPEFTAGIVRAFIAGGLSNQLPLKLYTTGPVFRYERPQKGRQRQFHQVNFEVLGVAGPLADIELIAMGAQIINILGVENKVQLEINSLGDSVSRDEYKTALVTYLNDYRNDLSDDSKVRLEKNPMRILDSKNEGDKKIIANAPVISDFYSDEAAEFFGRVQEGLKSLGVAFKINNHLVRGLDYYCHTAFEFITDALGAQNAVLAGGRYDALVKMMGGQDTPAVGFAGGVERMMALVDDSVELERPIVVVPIGERAEGEAVLLTHRLRNAGVYAELGYDGNVKKRMKKANAINARRAIIFGDDELDKKIVKLKDLDSGEEQDVVYAEVVDCVRSMG